MTPLADLELPIFAYELLETVASVDTHTKMRPNLELIFSIWVFECCSIN